MAFKEFKNFDDQIKLLEGRNLIISNKVRLTDYLKKYNYERIFKDYHSHFLHINNLKGNIIKYHDDITSDDILNFFDFEQSLSKTLIWTILEFEKKFSTLVAYYTTKHAITYASTEEEANKIKKGNLFDAEEDILLKIFENIKKYRIYSESEKELSNYEKINHLKEKIKRRIKHFNKYSNVTFWKSITNWNLSILNNFFNSLNNDIKKDILVDLFGFNFTISDEICNSFFRFISHLKKIRNSIVHNQKIYDILHNKRCSDLFEIYKIFYGKEAKSLSTGKLKLEIIYKILNKIVYQDYDLRNIKIKNIFLEFNLNKKVNQKLYNNIYIDELLIRK